MALAIEAAGETVLDLGIVLPRWHQLDGAGIDSAAERMRRAGVAVSSDLRQGTSTERRRLQRVERPGRFACRPPGQPPSRAMLDLRITLPRWYKPESGLQRAA